MSFHKPTQFVDLQSDLTALFHAAAAQYAKDAGLEPLSEQALSQMSSSLHDAAGEVLMFGCNAWPDTARPAEGETPFEVNPSQVDPPRERLRMLTWHIAILALTLPGTLVLSWYIGGSGFLFSFGVIAIALTFGSISGLVHSALVAILNNLLIVPPVFAFTTPTRDELVRLAFYLAVALVVPRIAKNAQKGRPRYLARSPLSGIAK